MSLLFLGVGGVFNPVRFPGAVWEFGSWHGAGWAYQDIARTTLSSGTSVSRSITNYVNSSFHFEQATGANAGTYAAGALNGKDGIATDALNDHWVSGSTATYNSSTGGFTVVKVLYSSPENSGFRYCSMVQSLTLADYDNSNSFPLGRNAGSFRGEHNVLGANPGSVTVAGGGSGQANVVVYRIDTVNGTHEITIAGASGTDTFTSHANFQPNYALLACGVDPVLPGISYFGQFGLCAGLGVNRYVSASERDILLNGYRGLYGL